MKTEHLTLRGLIFLFIFFAFTADKSGLPVWLL